MQQPQIDYILTKMLESHSNVSDLNVTVGKRFQVESSGQLTNVDFKPLISEITPFQAEIFALNLIDGDRRLTEILLREGSCDMSYSLAGKARFRVNIFSQRNRFSTVMRKLETEIPTVEQLKLPPAFKRLSKEKNGIILVTGGHRQRQDHFAGCGAQRYQPESVGPRGHPGGPGRIRPSPQKIHL